MLVTLRLFVILGLAVLLTACASAPQTKQLLEGPVEDLPIRAQIDKLAFYPQEKYQCGPAAVAGVFSRFGVEQSPEQLKSQIYLPEREGSLQVEIMAASRRAGLLPYQLAPSLHDLLAEVAAGQPVLVLQNLGLDSLPRWHYAVVVGYDLQKQVVVLNSGVTERLRRPLDLFEHTWAKSGYWALAITLPEQVPVTARWRPFLEAAYALESVGETANAARAYRAATLRWPAQPLIWTLSGNLALQRGESEQAVRDLGRALELDSGQATVWNNLAYALQANGCGAAAKQAIACALTLEPKNASFIDSQQELGSARGFTGGQACRLPACGL